MVLLIFFIYLLIIKIQLVNKGEYLSSPAEGFLDTDYFDVAQISDSHGIVAIIDSGIEQSVFNQFRDRILEAKSFLRGPDGCVGTGDAWDRTGHGTMIFKIIATVNPNVKFVILQ